MTNPIDAVLAAAAAYVETPNGAPALPGLYEDLEAAVQNWRLADSPAPQSPDPATALQALIIAARGATHARLIYTHDPGAAAVLDTALWPLLELTPPLGLIVLIHIPQSDGGVDRITFYGPEPES